MRKFASAFCFFLLMSAASMRAQTPMATISGIVKDTQGAAIQGAKVTVTNAAQGSLRETLTNSDGAYSIPNLLPGEYHAEMKSNGFALVQYGTVNLEAGRTVTLDAVLVPAGQVTTINVSAANQTVDLAQSMLQGQITENTIESIPLNGRNFLELAYLIPGNRPAPTFDPTKTNTLEISSAGGFGRGGNITIDGGDNNDEVVGGTLSNLPEDSIGEFQIATALSTSSAGRAPTPITALPSSLNGIATCRLFRLPLTAACRRRLLTASNTADPSAARYGRTLCGGSPLPNIATRMHPSRPASATSLPIQFRTPPRPLRSVTCSGPIEWILIRTRQTA
jgi:hypothetical protein